MKIGFAGLGQMGWPIAENLVKSGLDVTIASSRAEARAAFAGMGAGVAEDIAALGEADLIFLCLPDAQAVRQALGPNALGRTLQKGHVVIDLGTTAYRDTLEFAETLKGNCISFLDAPISGMEQRARDGTLTVMAGGRKEVFAVVEPHLRPIASTILYMGASGSGQLTKLVNQLLFDINAAGLAEILPMAVKLGLDPGQVAQVVNSGTGRSHASEFFLPRILAGSFGDGYPMKAAYKDLVVGAEISANSGIPLPVLAAATATYQQALLRGHGDLDKGGMIRVFEDLLGVEFRAANDDDGLSPPNEVGPINTSRRPS